MPVVVAVAIGQQAQTGRGTHFQQRQRLRQARQHRQERGATTRLIGLRAMCQHRRAHGGCVLAQQAVELRPVARRSAHMAQRGEQQVGLALFIRQCGEEFQRERIGGDTDGECLVERRTAMRLDLGKSPVTRRELFAHCIPRHWMHVAPRRPQGQVACMEAGPHDRRAARRMRGIAPPVRRTRAGADDGCAARWTPRAGSRSGDRWHGCRHLDLCQSAAVRRERGPVALSAR